MKQYKFIGIMLIVSILSIVNSFAYNYTFLGIGDSVLSKENSYVTSTQRFTYLVQQDLVNNYGYTGLTETNEGDSSTCLTDDALCVGRTPFLINRYETDLIDYQPYIAYILPNINDLLMGVDEDVYKTDLDTIVSNILSQTDNTTLILSTMTSNTDNVHPAGTQELSAKYNEVIREVAIKYNVPLLELNYHQNHNSSLRQDYVHLNVVGHQFISDLLVDLILNENDYVMTENNFNIYHDCDNVISLYNYTILSSTMNCAEDTTADWLVLTDIKENEFTITRADEPFIINITNTYNNNEDILIYYPNGTITNVTTTATGILSLSLDDNNLGTLYIEERPIIISSTININAIDNSINITMSKYNNNTLYYSTTSNIINFNNIVWGSL